jgi:hypothetical protein
VGQSEGLLCILQWGTLAPGPGVPNAGGGILPSSGETPQGRQSFQQITGTYPQEIHKNLKRKKKQKRKRNVNYNGN